MSGTERHVMRAVGIEITDDEHVEPHLKDANPTQPDLEPSLGESTTFGPVVPGGLIRPTEWMKA